MKKKYEEKILNQEFSLSKRSKNDKISTLSVKELGITAPQYSCFKLTLLGGITLEAYSNRANGTSLSIPDNNLPRFVTLPTLGNSKKLRILAIERLY